MTISWTCPNIFSTSDFVLPFANSVSSDAEALEMQQPEPVKLMSLILSPSKFEKKFQLVAAERIAALRLRQVAAGLARGNSAASCSGPG